MVGSVLHQLVICGAVFPAAIVESLVLVSDVWALGEKPLRLQPTALKQGACFA
jgi:hypothetical protein